MKFQPISRIWVFYGGILLFAAILSYKLFMVQILNGNAYSEKADRQYIAPVANTFNRGSIFFSEKDSTLVSAATLKFGFIVAINPSMIEDASSVFDALSAILPLDSDTFFIRASKKQDPYEEVARRVSQKDADKINALGIDGVIVSKEKWRFYPAGSSAAHVLGFVGYQGGELSGRYGLERYYDDVLTRDKDALYVNFFAEVFTNISESIFNRGEARDGDIVTTIESSVQGVLEGALADLLETQNAKSAGGIIINPSNGEIYALSNIPTFDPNSFNTEESLGIFTNALVENVFEMGSIIKPLTMAAGLDAGVVTPETEYNDKGYVLLDGKRIENYDGKARGVVPMQTILNKSLNTGAVFVQQKLGKESFRKYMLSFGLGEETGIDLPNETIGLVDNLSSPRDLEYATASFGQGIAMTPIATARALSVLGNGGTLITPHLVKRIDYSTGRSRNVVWEEGERVLKKETSEEITRMLVAVVDEALRGGTVALPNHSIAAKTGTAQIAREDGGGYYEDKFLHSFFGYFPAYDPKFLVFLYVVDPKNARYASQSLTAPFMDITTFLLNYYDVPPDR